MTISKRREAKAEQLLVEEFIKDLEATALQVQKLLEDIGNSKLDFATIKTELKYLVNNVKELSIIIRDGDGSGSVLTRLALIERAIEDIKTYVQKDSDNDAALATRIALLEQKVEILTSYVEKQKELYKLHKSAPIEVAGKWKLYATIATGVFTLLGSIIALAMSVM